MDRSLESPSPVCLPTTTQALPRCKSPRPARLPATKPFIPGAVPAAETCRSAQAAVEHGQLIFHPLLPPSLPPFPRWEPSAEPWLEPGACHSQELSAVLTRT